MINVIKDMLNQYDLTDISDIKYPFAEILQKVILVSLAKIGFFKEAVFCGGTSLRIFHKLKRFSEDLDFNLKKPNKSFKLSKYSLKLIDMLKSFDLDFEISNFKEIGSIQNAVLSTNLSNLIKKFADKKYLQYVRDNQKLKIKIEIDTNSPNLSDDDFEDKLLFDPMFCQVSLLNLSTLFAGKINAILTRQISAEFEKGRDYYDFLFYISKNIKPNLKYLQSSLSQFKIWDSKKALKINDLKRLLNDKFQSLNIELIKKDVSPLIKNLNELNDWSKELFISTLSNL